MGFACVDGGYGENPIVHIYIYIYILVRRSGCVAKTTGDRVMVGYERKRETYDRIGWLKEGYWKGCML